MNITYYIGMALTLILITSVGIYSGIKVKNASDFSVGGRKAGYAIIAGTIMGTLVGGASTVGTSELAFVYGFSAWWFTLGAGLGCLMLGLIFVKPIYLSRKETVPQILAQDYGKDVGFISSIFVSLGMFINIIAQILAAVALITSMFDVSPLFASFIAASFMTFYVIFGGVWGTGLVGIVKLILLYVAVIIGGTIAINLGGGISNFIETFPREQYFNIFARGVGVDLGAGFSLIIGVLSTQTYIQAVLCGKSEKASKKGALISAVLIPPIGLAGIFIGLYMKMNYPTMKASAVFPQFVLNCMPPFVAGIVMAALLIAVVGTGAGLALGISTMLTKDIYKNYINKNSNDKLLLKISRMLIVIVLFAAMILTAGNMKSMILKWSFMSMGLRGAAAFAPLCCSFFIKVRINSKFALAGVVLGPIGVLAGKFILPSSIDPLFLGITVSIGIFGIGIVHSKYRIRKR